MDARRKWRASPRKSNFNTWPAEMMEKINFHDGKITSISVNDKDFSIKIVTANDKLVTIDFLNTIALRVSDFSIQNIISRVMFSSNNDFSEQGLISCLSWVTSYSDSKSWLKQEKLLDVMKSLQSGTSELIVFEPSAGAEIACVCKKTIMQISQDKTEHRHASSR